MDFRRLVKKILGKGGNQNLEIQVAPFVIRQPQKFRGGVETLARALVHVIRMTYGHKTIACATLSGIIFCCYDYWSKRKEVVCQQMP